MIVNYISGSHADSLFDSSIASATHNANIYLIVKVYMEAYRFRTATSTVRDANGNSVEVTNWDPGIFRTFCDTFKRETEFAWNNRLWFVPSGAWGLDRGVYRPNIRLALRIDILTSPGLPHHLHLRCVNLARGERHRSFARHSDRFVQMDSQDGFSSSSRDGTVYKQFTGAHEIGHHLGLSHVNAGHCVSSGINTNNRICYGSTGHQRGDMMGAGSRVEVWHDRPWRNRLLRHLPNTSHVTWTTVTIRPVPQRIFREGELIMPP